MKINYSCGLQGFGQLFYTMCGQHLAYQLETLMPQLKRAIESEERKE